MNLSNEAGATVSAIDAARGARVTLRRALVVFLLLVLFLLGVMIIASLLGSERLPVSATLCAIFTGGSGGCDLSAVERAILFDVRLPRILLARSERPSLFTGWRAGVPEHRLRD
jgi:ABC-type enterobactin transport system permease subunit